MSSLGSMELKVQADISNLLQGMERSKKSISDFKSQLNRFQATLQNTTDPSSILRLNRAIEATRGKLKLIESAGVTKSLGAIKGSSNSAGLALLNLGRVAQDAPFGFIGIANNINPLLESFQRLKAESGSTKLALRALAGSLMGAGGLGIAVSVVTALMTVFAMQSRSGGDETEKAKKKVDENSQAQQKFAQDIRAASDAIISQAKNFKDLKEILSNTSLKYAELTEATKKQAFAQYLFSQRGEQVKNILDAIISKQLLAAKIKNPFAGAGIRQYSSDLLVYNRYLEDAKNGLVKFDKTTAEIKKNAQRTAEAQADLLNLNVISAGFDNIFEKLVLGKDKIKKSKETISDVIADLGRQIDFLNAKGLIFGTNEAKEKISAITAAIEKLVTDFKVAPGDTIIGKLTGTAFNDLFLNRGLEGVTRNIRQLQDQTEQGIKKIKETMVSGRIKLELPLFLKLKIEKLDFDEQEFKKLARKDKLISGIKDIAEEMQFVIRNAFGESLTGALSGANVGNVFGGFFKTILDSLGRGLQQLAIKAEAAQILIENLKKLFGTSAGIGASIALFALGSVIRALANSISVPGFAGGGENLRGGLIRVGERGPEMIRVPSGSDVVPNHALNSIGASSTMIVGEIRGDKMLLLLERATANKRRST